MPTKSAHFSQTQLQLKILDNVCHRCRMCEYLSANILRNQLFPLSSRLPEKSATSPINPIYSGNEGEAPENNTNVDLFTHLQGSSVGKTVKWRAKYAYTGGKSTRLLEESKLIRRQLTQLQMQTNNLSCIHIQRLRSLILYE